VTATVVGSGASNRTRFPNGLVVRTEFVPGVRSVSIGVWVRAASLHERREQMGISHLLEHLVFKGTERRSAREIALALESRGGSLDAYTGREHTCYQAHVLDRDLPVAVDLLRDLVLSPLLREQDLRLERQVIYDEIALVEDTPDDLAFERHNKLLWADHPYGHTILGTRDSLGAMSASDVRAIHAREYRPDNIVIAAAGNIDHDNVVALLDAAGWSAPGDRVPEARVSRPPTPAAPRVEHVSRDSQQTHIVFGSTTIPMGDPMRPAFLVLSTLLGGGMSSRLFQRIREELGLAYAVYAFQSLYADVGVHGVYVGTAPETATQALDAVRDELRRLTDDGVGEDELQLGRQQMIGQFLLSLESVGARMNRAASRELYNEPYRTVDEVIARIEGVTPNDLLNVARAWHVPERQTVVVLGPGKDSREP
jgi:predicted Zn-dependent peptidase